MEDNNLNEASGTSDHLEKDNKKREAFGNRHLTTDQDVFEFNAW